LGKKKALRETPEALKRWGKIEGSKNIPNREIQYRKNYLKPLKEFTHRIKRHISIPSTAYAKRQQK